MRIQWWLVLASCLVLSCSGDKTTGDSGGEGDTDTDTDSDTDTDADTDTDTVAPPECPGLASATVCQGKQSFTTTAPFTGGSGYYYWSYGVPTVVSCAVVALKFNSAGNVLIGTWDAQCNRTDEEATWTCADNAAEISGHGSATWDSTTGTLETDEWGTLTTAGCQI